MASRTTKGGLSRRARCRQDTNFAGMKRRESERKRSSKRERESSAICDSISTSASTPSEILWNTCLWHFFLLSAILSAIFQTWFFRNSRSHGKTFSIPKLLSVRYHDSWTYCSRCATTGQCIYFRIYLSFYVAKKQWKECSGMLTVWGWVWGEKFWEIGFNLNFFSDFKFWLFSNFMQIQIPYLFNYYEWKTFIFLLFLSLYMTLFSHPNIQSLKSHSKPKILLTESANIPDYMKAWAVDSFTGCSSVFKRKPKFTVFFVSFLTHRQQKKFPIDNLAEWNHNNNPLGLRSMQVYVLCFDMGNLETFQVNLTRGMSYECSLMKLRLNLLQYCRSIREQILSSFTHRNFSIMVVGNKFDLVVDSPNYSQVNGKTDKIFLRPLKRY